MGRRPEGAIVDSETMLDGMASPNPDPEEQASRTELLETVKGSLEELPREQREAVVLCDLEGLSYEEMADVIGIPVGTVRSRVFRGRRALQRKLSPYIAIRNAAERRNSDSAEL
jgi:RNA polymerase sigma-70 factor (ECF subfamily)